MIKKYKITRDYWECNVEIDEAAQFPQLSTPEKPYTLNDAMIDMIKFWSGGNERLENNDGDVTKTFLQQLAREIQYIILEFNYNLNGVLSELKNREGWFAVDGSNGIKITFIDDLEIPHDEFIVEEVES